MFHFVLDLVRFPFPYMISVFMLCTLISSCDILRSSATVRSAEWKYLTDLSVQVIRTILKCQTKM